MCVIDDFVWTGFDYDGEAGIGWMGMGEYPCTVAYCGDIGICGFNRPQSHYSEIIWGTGDKKVAAFVKKRFLQNNEKNKINTCSSGFGPPKYCFFNNRCYIYT